MKNIFLISASALILAPAANASTMENTHFTHTPDAKPVYPFKIAASYFLPGYDGSTYKFENDTNVCTKVGYIYTSANCSYLRGKTCKSGDSVYYDDCCVPSCTSKTASECPYGFGSDISNGCGSICKTCRVCNDTCASGSKSSCDSQNKVQTSTVKTECGTTCYVCRAKTDTCPSGQLKSCSGDYTIGSNGSRTETGVQCYNCVLKDDTCPAGQAKSCGNNQIPSTGSKTDRGTQCFSCRNKTCADYNNAYKSEIPTGQKCDTVTASTVSGLTCYKNCSGKTCADYNSTYKPEVPTGQKCDTVTAGTVGGLTCYKNCSGKTCADYDSAYKSEIPTGQKCDTVTAGTVGGLTCYKNCTAKSGTCSQGSLLKDLTCDEPTMQKKENGIVTELGEACYICECDQTLYRYDEENCDQRVGCVSSSGISSCSIEYLMPRGPSCGLKATTCWDENNTPIDRSCPKNQYLDEKRTCVCASWFKYNKDNCKGTLKGDICNGLYEQCDTTERCSKGYASGDKCPRDTMVKTANGTKSNLGNACYDCVCPAKYKYNSSNCQYPNDTCGSSCNGLYEECSTKCLCSNITKSKCLELHKDWCRGTCVCLQQRNYDGCGYCYGIWTYENDSSCR